MVNLNLLLYQRLPQSFLISKAIPPLFSILEDQIEVGPYSRSVSLSLVIVRSAPWRLEDGCLVLHFRETALPPLSCLDRDLHSVCSVSYPVCFSLFISASSTICLLI